MFITRLFNPKIFPRFLGDIKSQIKDVEETAIAPPPKPTRKLDRAIR